VLQVAFHPTLPFLASCSIDKTVKLWDCSDPQNTRQVETLTGHTDDVLCVAFHQNLPLIVSGSRDKTIKLWK
jgi:WD40 repeat protein